MDEDLVRFKMTQAADSLEQAKSLLTSDIGLDFIADSAFNAMFYSVLALLLKRKVPASTQDATISLFEREYIRTGTIDRRLLDALHLALDIRNASLRKEQRPVTKEEIDGLLRATEEFVQRAHSLIDI